MADLASELSHLVDCETDNSPETLESHSHDASMFELKPQVVVFPKTTEDVKNVVNYVRERRKSDPEISITARSAGTDMSGAAIGQSIILDYSRHFKGIPIVNGDEAEVKPGTKYHDFEVETLKSSQLMPSYPASRELCTLGGMVANNAGGEKSLRDGKTENFVTELKVVLSDGQEYVTKPLDQSQLKAKMAQQDFEGEVYRRLFELLDMHYQEIKAAKPKVSKDSTGYHLWDVWDRETGIFDINRLLVGSQGTLGQITNIKLKLVKKPKYSGTLVIFLRHLENLGELINKVLEHKPSSFEGFDNYTLMLSFKLFPYFRKNLGWWGMSRLALKLIPDAFKLIRGIPKMVLLVEFDDDDEQVVAQKVRTMHEDLKVYGHEALFEEDETEAKSRKFWIMRRESFNLLRQKVKDKHTAPFIDDLVVPPEHLPQFLPQVRQIINKYKLLATVAGHMGDGNFHIIPLMNIENNSERDKLEPVMREINQLVLSYGGSLSGEHNDGMIRGPWLEQMYGPVVTDYFRQVKEIFDPDNIFNPHKKTDADWQFSMSHLRKKF